MIGQCLVWIHFSPSTTKVVSSNPVHCEVYSMYHYVVQFVSDLRQVHVRLIRSLKKFIFRYQYLVEIYSVSAEKIISDAFSYSENV